MFDVDRYYFIAHKGEARVHIQKRQLSQTGNKNIYTNKNTVLCITGMANSCVTKMHETFKLYPPNTTSQVINLGIAGCVDENVAIGSVFSVGSLFFEDEKITINDGVACRSFTKVQTQKFEGILCDMESFFFVKKSLKYVDKKNIKVYKVVSDHLKDAKIPSKQQLNEWIEKVYAYENGSRYGS